MPPSSIRANIPMTRNVLPDLLPQFVFYRQILQRVFRLGESLFVVSTDPLRWIGDFSRRNVVWPRTCELRKEWCIARLIEECCDGR